MIIVDFVYFIYIVIITPYYLFKFLTSKYHRQGLLERFGFVKFFNYDRSAKGGSVRHGESACGMTVGTGMQGKTRIRQKRCIWLHAASVGEIKASEVLINNLRRLYPDYEFVISTLTPSAQELVKEKYPDIRSFFFPLDLSLIIRRVLKRINPALIILIEQELWLNLIRIAASKRIPVILLNGRITKHSTMRYRLIKPVISRIWNKISCFCVQNKEYFERFKTLGVNPDKIRITGNMKYDLLDKSHLSARGGSAEGTGKQEKDHIRQADEVSYRKIFGFNKNDLVIIGGSTHHPEEEILLEVYSNLKRDINNLRLIIAPRHSFRFDEVEKLIKTKGFESLRRSTLSTRYASEERRLKPAATIILLDTLGELSKIYSIADVVFVGGSFVRRGGQSILEPALSGKPVLFGPDMSNFQEMADLLIKENAAISVIDKSALYQQLNHLFKEPAELKKMGERAQIVISQYQGATIKNIEFIKNLLTPLEMNHNIL
ncbi:MAG: 3-deoxy-D-manno-octulosonic acid transferase [Planctomycetota bacterium]